jgi:hypothetical protein
MAARATIAVQRYDWNVLVDDIEAVYAAVIAVSPTGTG